MTKSLVKVIAFVGFFALLLSGCKMPASTPPTEEVVSTPIPIQTDELGLETEPADEGEADEGEEQPAPTATLEGDQSPEAEPTATSEPTEVVPVPTITTPAEYTINEGEYAYCLARRFDLNPEDLLSINNLDPDELIEPGTTLQIPQEGSWPGDDRSLLSHPTDHTVSAGETVYSIACDYGDVTPEAIIAVNNLEEPYELSPGQTLFIP